MVEAAKAQNPFAIQSDVTNCCPHMARLGICLEPAMCFLIHKIPGGAVMTTEAKNYNPFANTGENVNSVLDFVPSDS